ncbi:MAG: tRNA dihydrouridine synthase [Fibrobacterota bacterium]
MIKFIPGGIVLAPLAGITHPAFRSVVSEYGGCGLYYSEMLSCKSVTAGGAMNKIYTKKNETDRPFFYQLFSGEKDDFLKAGALLSEKKPDGFDINLGCSAPEITRRGAGTSLLERYDYAAGIIDALIKETGLPVSVKVRCGIKERDYSFISKALKTFEDAGAAFAAVHPRCAKEKFSRKADWTFITRLKQDLKMPIGGNGDIMSANDAVLREKKFKCDFVMVGRASVWAPWIFKKYHCLKAGKHFEEPDREKAFFSFLEKTCELFPTERTRGRILDFASYFCMQFKFGHNLYSRLRKCSSLESIRSVAESFFKTSSSSEFRKDYI